MLTIVTVNYNNARGLIKTIDSVCAQSVHDEIEHIVVDAGSTDGSCEILTEYSRRFPSLRSISEPDRGIYDGMNKGLRMARGRHVAFLNSGDELAHPDILSDVMAILHSDETCDMLYGDIVIVDANNSIKRFWRTGKLNKMKLMMGWMPPHPMTVFKLVTLEKVGKYDTSYRIAADYDLMLKFVSYSSNIQYLPRVVVRMEDGGVSSASWSNIIKSNLEVLRSWYKLRGLRAPFWIFITKPLLKTIQLFRRM